MKSRMLFQLDLLLEVAPNQGSFAHVPALPGLCFWLNDPDQAPRVALDHIARYAGWLLAENLLDLNDAAAALVGCARNQDFSGVQVIERERRTGAPLWISGNAAVLFEYDCHPLDDAAVHAHLRFAHQVVKCISEVVAGMSLQQRAQKPAPQDRSMDETLTHIGNCVWWYCARIDDALPEPEEPAGEDPMDRIVRLLDFATGYLLAIPFAARTLTHIPSRFRTLDPHETWTFTKVCRRQAEHLWEHFLYLSR